MAKNVFRPSELKPLDDKVFIQAPVRAVPVAVEEVEELEEEYTGPSVDDLQKEAQHFKEVWDKERETMIAAAKAEAETIVKDAETAAFEEIRKKNEQAVLMRHEAEEKANAIVAEAEKKAQEMEAQALKKSATLEEEARQRGFQEGRDKGYAEGKTEAERLVDRIHTVLSKTIEKRGEIIQESEAQLIQLVLQISKKVVKVLSENQKNIVINNILQALKKLKTRTDIVIRVNLLDLNMVTEHAKELVAMFEKVKNVTVLEDSTVDKGGCIIETDFGQIDARISSQLREIEEKILELMPIQDKEKPPDRE